MAFKLKALTNSVNCLRMSFYRDLKNLIEEYFVNQKFRT